MTVDVFTTAFLKHPEPMWLVNGHSGKIIELNHAAIRHLHCQRDPVLNQDLDLILPAAQNPGLKGQLEALQEAAPQNFQVNLQTGQGDWSQCEVTITLLQDQVLLMVLRDPNRMARERLLQQLTGQMPVMLYQIETQPDGNLKMTYVSDAIRTIMGLEPEDVLKDPRAHYRLILPEDLQPIREVHNHAIDQGKGWKLEYRIKHGKTGELRWIFGQAVSHLQADGHWIWFGFISDITEIRRLQESLQISNERLQLAKEIAGIGIWELDIDSRTMHWDPKMFEIYGLPDTGTLSLESWKALVHPDDRAMVDTLGPQTMGRKPYTLRHRILRPDGEIRQIIMYGIVLYDQRDQATKAIGLNVDITESMQVEAELLASKSKLEGMNVQLHERVKELSLLHQIARLLQAKSEFTPSVLEDLVNLLPPSWLYPEFCVARISWGDLTACTAHWRESEWVQSYPFESGGIQGKIEVAYLQKTPEMDEGPFLTEERTLLGSIAEMLSIYLEQQHANLAIKAHEARILDQNRRLREIAWKQSHLVRRPLANIMGLIELLEYQDPIQEAANEGTDSQAKILEYVLSEAHNLDLILQDIVATSQRVLNEPEPKVQSSP